VKEIVRCLKKEKKRDPVPLDFSSEEGFRQWNKITKKMNYNYALIKMVDHYCLKSDSSDSSRIQQSDDACDIRLRMVGAKELLAKEGKTRNAYAVVTFDGSRYQTEVVNSNSPTWKEDFTISVTNTTESLSIEVYDKAQGGGKLFGEKKDEFLGVVRLKMSDLIKKCRTAKNVASWVKLQRKTSKDKYAGGEVRIEAQLLVMLYGYMGQNCHFNSVY
jgi:hypothetical protein